MAKKWMQKAFAKNKGALHRDLGVDEDKPIPYAKLLRATKSKKLKLKRRALAAMNARHANNFYPPKK